MKSEENPADPASRGLTADQLSSCALWFLGPPWLQQETLPITPFAEEILENEEVTTTLTTHMYAIKEGILDNISSWTKAIRVVAYCLGWKYNTKGGFTAEEIRRAKCRFIRYYQELHLSEVISKIRSSKPIEKRHWVNHLTSPSR